MIDGHTQVLHRWYSWLHSNIPGTGVTAVGQRLLLDQACFAPIFIPSFMATLLMLEGSAQPIAAAQEQWWPAIVANWKLWVPAQIVNFAIVPPHFQASRERDRTRMLLTCHGPRLSSVSVTSVRAPLVRRCCLRMASPYAGTSTSRGRRIAARPLARMRVYRHFRCL